MHEIQPPLNVSTLLWWEGLRASMTLRSMLAGTHVSGRGSQAGQAVREKPD